MSTAFCVCLVGWQRTRRVVFTLAVSLLLLAFSSSLFAQANLARLTGAVRDQTGGVMVGVAISVTDADRGLERSTVSDATGQYLLPGLLPGRKTVRAEYQGFRAFEQSNVVLGVAQDARIDIVMQPGEVTETVRVTEAPPLLDTTSAELGGTLQNQEINDLPLNGRNFENLLDLRPGVTKYPGNSGWTQSTNGLRPHDNYFMVDGINSNDPWMAQSMMNAVMAAGDAGTVLPIDAIEEFKTQENPRAEFGWKPGAVVNVGIKSGTNQYHGTAYAYGRENSWDALNYFTAPGSPESTVNLEQFGGSIGGPIRKDKLFFFGNFEQQRYEVGNPAPHEVPITAPGSGPAAQNLITACQTALGLGTLRPLSAQLAGLSPTCGQLPNYPGLFPVNPGPTTTINTALASVNNINSGVGKIDYHPNAKNSVSGMYFISPGSGTFVDNPTLQIAQPWLTEQYARSQVGSGNWIWTPTTSMVNSLRVGYSHYYQTFFSADGSQNPANYSYNGTVYNIYTGQNNPAYYGLPAMTMTGGYSFEFGLGWPKTVGPDGVWQISDSVSVLRGNHTLKYGGEVLLNQSTNNVTSNTKGNLRFSGLTGFFSGTINRARFTAGDFLRHLSSQGYGAFVQDDWRVSRRLTVNLGLRYELNTVPKDSQNLLGNFDPNAQYGIVQVGKQIGSLYNGNHHDFAPRVGLAFDVFGNGKTVIRAAGGVFYEQGSYDYLMAIGNLLGARTLPTGVPLYMNGSQTPVTAGGNINLGAITLTGPALGPVKSAWANNSSSNPLFSATPACGDGTVTLPNGFTPSPCDVAGVDRNLRTPYVISWNFGIQQAITPNLSLDVAYVGNHATKLVGLTDLNQPQLVNGFSPGWGNPNTPGSPANLCLASAGTGYDNCNPDGGAEQAARPFAKKFPYLGYIYWLSNSNFSNYDGLQVAVTKRTSHGLSFVLGYTFSHALAQSPDNWSFINPIDSRNTRNLYGNSPFDLRHRFTYSITYAIPGKKTPGHVLEGWSLNSIVTLESGMPWGINDGTTDFSGTNEIANGSTIGEQWDFYGNPSDFKTTKNFWMNTNGGAGGIPYSGGASNVPVNPACMARAQALGPLAVASLTDLGCYSNGSSVLIPPAYGSYGTTGPNIFRGPGYFNVDLSVTKAINFGERLRAQFRGEAFNIFNHPNIGNPFGGPGGGNTYTDPSATAGASFGFQPLTPDVISSNPVLGSGGARAIQLGLKLIF
jgi:Carboxypeptidase regulatory-like domain